MTNLARIIVDHNKNFREKIKKVWVRKGKNKVQHYLGAQHYSDLTQTETRHKTSRLLFTLPQTRTTPR
jgi:hypothetical protein